MKPNLLFINFPNVPLDFLSENLASDTFLTLKKWIPLGILYLSSFVKKHNRLGRVGIVDYAGKFEEVRKYKGLDAFIEKTALENVGFVPDIILCSLMFSVSHVFCLRVIELLSDIWPAATFVVGGVHATNYAEKLLENQNIDYVVRGEGETALSTFIDQFSQGRAISVKGVYSRKEKRQVSRPLELCEFIHYLDFIPFPDWDLVDMDLYTKITYVTVTGREKEKPHDIRSAVILTTRGCPGRCTFCSQHTVHGRKLRYRSVDNVIAEIKLLHEQFNVTTFVPNDDMFLSNRERDLELMGRIKELSIPNLEMQFPNGLHVNSMHSEIMDALIDAGTKIVNLAIESGSKYVQKHVVKKHVNLKKAREVVEYFRNKGIYTRCFFILGFPGETRKQMQETIEFAKSLSADWCDFSEATPLIGSEMFRQFKEMRYIKEDDSAFSNTYFLGTRFDTKEISAVDLKTLAYRANLECNFINNPNKRIGHYNKAISLFEAVSSRYPFHIVAWYSMMQCYEKLGRQDKIEEIRRKIGGLIQTNSLALDMYRKYNDLMPEIRYECVNNRLLP